MSSLDSVQTGIENTEAQIVSGQNAAKPIVDMSDPNQVRSSFKPSEGQNQSSVSESGQMVFSNIYGGNEEHGRHDLGQGTNDGVGRNGDGGGWGRDGGGRGGDDARRGGEGGGQWPGRNGGNNDNGGQQGGAGAEQLAGQGGTNNNAVEAELLLNETNILQTEIGMIGQSGQSGATAQPTDGGTSTAPSGIATDNPPTSTTSGGDTTVSTGPTGNVTVQQIESQVQQIEQAVAQVTSEVGQLLPGSTSGGSGSETQPTTTGTDNPTTTTSGGAGASAISNPTVAVLEQADPALAATLNLASTTMSQDGLSSVQNYLATNNPNGNTNLDATLMSSALTQANLSTTDATQLQNAEIADMPGAQILTYAQQSGDTTLYNTLNDIASSSISTQGWGQVENYLASNYTGDQYMDGTLMNNVLNQSGLSPTDQTAVSGVLQTDMPTALAADPFVAGLQATDPTMYQTMSDASTTMTAAGYQNLEGYVENNYTGQTSSDSAILGSALVGLEANPADALDAAALTNVLTQDMPGALTNTAGSTTGSDTGTGSSTASGGSGSTGTGASGGSSSAYNPASDAALQNLSNTGDAQLQQTLLNAWSDVQSGQLSASAYSQFEAAAIPLTTPANDPGGVPFTGDTPLEQAALSSIQSNLSAGDVATLQSLIGGGQTAGTGTTDTTGGTGTTDNTGGSGTTGSTGNGGTTDSTAGGGNPSSTTTFETGGNTLLVPPQSSSGLVTPVGSESGTQTAYQGPIEGTISGKNNVTSDAEITGQGNGPDALQITPTAYISSMDTTTGQGFQQKYGYFEADIKLSQSNGQVSPNLWPGWYLESSAHTLNPSAAPSSEIDIMEAQTSNTNGQGDTSYNAGVHLNSGQYDEATYGNGSVQDQDAGPYTTKLPSLSSGYNTYGVNWQPNDPNIEFYFNGQEVGYNKVYDTTDSSPMNVILDADNGGWSTSDPNATGGSMDVAWVRVFQNANLVNSANDPDGTVAATMNDTNPADNPPALTNASDGAGNTPVTWKATFTTDFTQASDYTTNGADTTALLNPNSGNNPNVPTSGNLSTDVTGAQNTPWYEAQWMVDQSTSAEGVPSGVSTTPGANG